jgi:hypothetical protein
MDDPRITINGASLQTFRRGRHGEIMQEETVSTTTQPALTPQERLELANRLYREYHAQCFWHCPRDLDITDDLIPMVVAGLRKHGGRQGFILSAQLRHQMAVAPAPLSAPETARPPTASSETDAADRRCPG